MSEVIVVAPPRALEFAQKLANELSALGVSADAPDLSMQWTEANWRGLGASWPQGAFIVFCLTNASASDSILQNLTWRLVPIDPDTTGRFIFAFFKPDVQAREKLKTFADIHFSADGGDAAAIASHVKSHRQAMTDFLEAMEVRRRAQAESPAVLQAPRPAPAPQRPEGIGSGYSDDTPKVGGEGRLGGMQYRSAPSASAPMPAPQTPSPTASAPSEKASRKYSAAPPLARKKAASPPVIWEESQNASMSGGLPSQPRPARLDKVDSMAFAPKTLRRGTPELIRVAIFQPKDRGRAQRSAKQADPQTTQAGGIQMLGYIERGATVSAVLDARGIYADITRLDAQWSGGLLDFNFPVEALDDVAQALITVRILVDDAQIGAITFTRPIIKARKDGRASKLDSREKLRRVSRVFLSYSSNDRTPVSLIASAYQRVGVQCFFDRTGLKSGEEWSPRLLREIERADLFHLCWSRNACASEWVEKETAYAMTKRRRSGGKKPDITIQMLDGPPWAPHPQSLDALNFDDYARAAVVGYARGDSA